MPKRCFGEYSAFNDECDRCHELKRYCKMWKNNMFNFKRKRNSAIFVCFIIVVAWNVKIGFDLMKDDSKLFTVLSFSALLLFFLALRASIKSRKTAMKAYQAHTRPYKGNPTHITLPHHNIFLASSFHSSHFSSFILQFTKSSTLD